MAAGLAPVATASDTGGSIRQPAALTGLTGFKPSYGRVSRWGMVAFASSLDQAGILARSAEDCALLLGAMAGHDDRDATSVARPVDDYHAALNTPLAGLRVGVPEEFFPAQLDAGIAEVTHAALAQLEQLGATLVPVRLPSIDLSVAAYYVIAPAEASSNLARFDGVRYGYRCDNPRDIEDLFKRSRSEAFGDEVKRRILVGTYALSHGYYDAYYLQAQRVRRQIANEFNAALAEVDVLVGPTTPDVAFPLGARTDDPVTLYMADMFTIGANLAGLPALSMPAGLHQGLPVGVQVIGRPFEEGRILNLAHQFQQATEWHQLRPGFGGEA